MIPLTLWPSLYNIDSPEHVTLSWDELVARFSNHVRVQRKDQASGFGPYRLTPPPVACYKHNDGLPRTEPHRCDTCVREMTLLVFDADTGTRQDFNECERRLKERGLARLWYSSFSYSPDRPAFRLIIPLTRHVPPEQWTAFRLAARRIFGVPADPKACSGKSHFYYSPSCAPYSTPKVISSSGQALDPQELVQIRDCPQRSIPVVMDSWRPPAETEHDLGPILEGLHQLAEAWKRNPPRQEKGELLARCLAGEPLAEEGSRNKSALIVAGVLAWHAVGYPLNVYKAIMAKSIEAMLAASPDAPSWEQVDRMLLTAMRNQAQAEAAQVEVARSASTRVQNMERSLRGGM